MGNAILIAAQQIKEPLMQSASELLETPVERLVARERYIFDRDNPDRRLELKEAARRTMVTGRRMAGQGWYAPPKATLDPKTGQGSPYFVYSYATQMAEVEVDMGTGEATYERSFPHKNLSRSELWMTFRQGYLSARRTQTRSHANRLN